MIRYSASASFNAVNMSLKFELSIGIGHECPAVACQRPYHLQSFGGRHLENEAIVVILRERQLSNDVAVIIRRFVHRDSIVRITVVGHEQPPWVRVVRVGRPSGPSRHRFRPFP
jgi:hypothetical protein